MKVVAFIEPRAPAPSNGRGDVIEEILKHCGLWQASAPRAPPDVDGLVLDLDAAYSDTSLVSPDQADESQELTYVDIDTFLASFSSSPPHVGMGMVRTSYGIDPYFASIDLYFVLRAAPTSHTPTSHTIAKKTARAAKGAHGAPASLN